MKSYLTALDDGSFMRVQYGSKINGLLVEYYDKDFNLTGTKIIGKELPVFGGFYAIKDNYYVVTGENNTDEDNTKEVYRITKYDKHWNKITSTGLTNCNTTKPFNAGSCRIDVSGNKIVWYTWNNGDINFYDIKTTDLSVNHITEIHNGHQYAYDPDSDTDDTITFRCTACDAQKIEKKIVLDQVYWRNSEATDDSYWWYERGWKQKTGTMMTSLIKYVTTSSDASAETNTELEVTSTDKSVISVEKAKGINIKLVANKAGTSTVTVRPKYNPASAKTYKITVYDPLQINKFEADTNDPKIGEKVNLSVEAQNGSGDLQYKFYEAKITNVSNEIVIEAQKTDASYSYNVSKNGNIGNQAEIEFTIHSNNYEDITFKVHITLTDIITVTPKEGTEPAIEGSNDRRFDFTFSKSK